MLWPPTYSFWRRLWLRVLTRPLCWMDRHLLSPWDAGGMWCVRCWGPFPNSEHGKEVRWLREWREEVEAREARADIQRQKQIDRNRESFFGQPKRGGERKSIEPGTSRTE